MGNYTFLDRLLSIFWLTPKYKIEYYFAKRFLDCILGDYVGKQEYWGEYLFKKLIHPYIVNGKFSPPSPKVKKKI